MLRWDGTSRCVGYVIPSRRAVFTHSGCQFRRVGVPSRHEGYAHRERIERLGSVSCRVGWLWSSFGSRRRATTVVA